MNRNDWVFVGIRLFGLFLVVCAILGLVGLSLSFSSTDTMASSAGELIMIAAIALMGLMLLLGAPGIVSWLQRKDDALAPSAKRTQTDWVSGGR